VPLFEPVLFVVPDAPVLPVVPEAPMPPLVPELLVPPALVPPTLPPDVLPDVRPEVPEVLDGLVLDEVLPEDDGLVDDVPLDDVPREVVPLPLTLPELLRLELPEVYPDVPVLDPVLFVVPEAPIPPLVPLVLPEVVPPVELPEVVPPRLLPEVLLPVEPVVPVVEAESSMQSMWTGLFECSLALPVSLFASLPAFGWFRLLQVGLLPVVLVLELEGEVPDVLLDVEGDVAEVLLPCEREVLLVAEPLRDADEALVELPVAVLPLVLPDVWA